MGVLAKTRRSPDFRQRRATRMRAVSGLVPAIVGWLFLACGDGAPPAPGPVAREPDGSFAVGRVRRTFVDTTRSTPGFDGHPDVAGRTLPTLVLYPAEGAVGTAPGDGAPPARAAGPFPLVVFAHGYGGVADVYLELLGAIASAGYVVVAPDFPVTSTLVAGGLDDYVSQPADLSFLVDEALAWSGSAESPLAGLVDPDRVGAAGQSLGGVTTWGVTHQACCRDARIRAGVPMAGALFPFPGDGFAAGGPPMLVIHGTADDTVPYARALDAYAATEPPRALLTLPGGDHILPYVKLGERTPALQSTIDATTAFLDLELKRERGAFERLLAVASPGVAELHTDGLAEP